MGTNGQDAAERGGGYPGIGNVLHVTGTGGADIWIRFMDRVGSDGEDNGRYTHRVPAIDNGGVGAINPR